MIGCVCGVSVRVLVSSSSVYRYFVYIIQNDTLIGRYSEAKIEYSTLK